jgi:hypothetical protein
MAPLLSSTNALIQLCERMNEKYKSSLDIDVGLSAVFVAVHFADWYYFHHLGHPADRQNKKYFNDVFKAQLEQLCPHWETLRQIANGLKHPKKRARTRLIVVKLSGKTESFGNIAVRRNSSSFLIIGGRIGFYRK